MHNFFIPLDRTPKFPKSLQKYSPCHPGQSVPLASVPIPEAGVSQALFIPREKDLLLGKCHVLGRCALQTLSIYFCPCIWKDTSIREMMFLQEIRLSFSNLMSFSEITHECRIQLTLSK